MMYRNRVMSTFTWDQIHHVSAPEIHRFTFSCARKKNAFAWNRTRNFFFLTFALYHSATSACWNIVLDARAQSVRSGPSIYSDRPPIWLLPSSVLSLPFGFGFARKFVFFDVLPDRERTFPRLGQKKPKKCPCLGETQTTPTGSSFGVTPLQPTPVQRAAQGVARHGPGCRARAKDGRGELDPTK